MNRYYARHQLQMKAATLLCLGCLVMLAAASAGAQTAGTGYWHTSGNQILDSNNKPVRMAGVNWYGFETTDAVIHGLWAQDYHSIINTIKSNGYNVIRIPFSNQMVESNPVPTNLSFNNGSAINTDLQGLTSLQILDKIVAAAGTAGLRVILDNHRSEEGNSAESNGLWYTSSFPESNWISDWQALTNRYLNNTTVIGMDLRNEPHNATSGGSCWGCGTTTNDWSLAAERAGNAVLAINPHLLIFVEGTDCFNGDCDWWGGNLEGVAQFPVTLSVANQLVYSAHDYGPAVFQQSWFNSSTTAATLQAHWVKDFAYIYNAGTAPIWVGEFGTGNNATDVQDTTAGSEGQWFSNMVQFLASNPSMNWTYWALNGEDSFALLDSNYDSTPVNAIKQQMLASIQFPLNGGSGGGGTPAAPAITAISPTSAAPGTSITITGTNFSSTANANTVKFGAATGTVTAATATSLTVTVPNIAAGAVSVTVSVGGTGSNAVSFTINGSTGSAAPTITSISPTSATPGTSVTITGTNFSTTAGANTVAFGSAAATVTAATATSLTVTVPNIAAGAVSVTVTVGGSASNSASFTVTSAGTGNGGVAVTTVINSNGAFFDDEGVKISNTAAVTALSITINVQNTGGLSFSGQYNTVGGSIVDSHSSTATVITYQYSLGSGQTLNPGSGYLFDAQISATGTAHPVTGDTFTVTYTTGGQTFTQSGVF